MLKQYTKDKYKGQKFESHIEDVPIIEVKRYLEQDRYSVYKGILIIWYEESSRVIHTIDELPRRWLRNILAIQVRKGTMIILWKRVPKNLPDGMHATDGDWWSFENLDFSKGELF